MTLKEFKNKASDEFKFHRNNLRENFTWIEHFCQKKGNKGNHLDWLSEKLNLIDNNRPRKRFDYKSPIFVRNNLLFNQKVAFMT